MYTKIFRASRRTPDSPSAELTHLLNQIITTAEAASSSSAQTENMLSNEGEQNNIQRRRRRRPPYEVESETQTDADERTVNAEKAGKL